MPKNNSKLKTKQILPSHNLQNSKMASKKETVAKPAIQLEKVITETKQARGVVGRVVSAKTLKTAVVIVARKKMHPLYHKSIVRSKKYLVHDEIGTKPGDVIEMVKTRPISKNKHWKIVKVIGKDIVAVVTKQLKEDAEQAIAEIMPEEKKEEEPTKVTEEIKEITEITEIKNAKETKKIKEIKKEKKQEEK